MPDSSLAELASAPEQMIQNLISPPHCLLLAAHMTVMLAAFIQHQSLR